MNTSIFSEKTMVHRFVVIMEHITDKWCPNHHAPSEYQWGKIVSKNSKESLPYLLRLDTFPRTKYTLWDIQRTYVYCPLMEWCKQSVHLTIVLVSLRLNLVATHKSWLSIWIPFYRMANGNASHVAIYATTLHLTTLPSSHEVHPERLWFMTNPRPSTSPNLWDSLNLVFGLLVSLLIIGSNSLKMTYS